MYVVSNDELQIVAGGQLSAATPDEAVSFNGLNSFNGKVILSSLPAQITPIVEKVYPIE